MAVARTVREVIEGSLRKIGAIAAGETPTAEDMAVGLIVLQDLLAEWSDGGLVVPCTVLEAITLVIGQNSYTVGQNGVPSLNTVRPEQIIEAFVKSGGYDYPVTIIGEKAYQGFLNKTTQGRPERLWYNATAPNGTIYVYYTPDTADQLWISSIKPFTEPTGLAENLLNTTGIPRNYHNPLIWNLAVDLAPEFGLEASPTIIARAIQGYSMIVSLNAARRVQPAYLEIPGISGRSNNDDLIAV